MKRLIALMTLVTVLIVSSSVIWAGDDQETPNHPAVNDRANACYTGGTLAGKCDTDMLWTAGWYLIRLEYGIIKRADFPRALIWVLPPEVQEKIIAPGGTGGLDMTCYIQVGTTEYESASAAVLSGANEGDFYWSAGRLMNDFSGWPIWDNNVWSVGYYGDCNPLGVGGPAPLDLNVVLAP